MTTIDARMLRERGYEALFLLGGILAWSLKPTFRHGIELEGRISDIIQRRREFRQLRERGLIQTGGHGRDDLVRLTELGREVLSGGRVPEVSWARSWDGLWRIVLFDMPRDARATRAKFWRWLRANHFGRYQASAWITPDPVPEICEAAEEMGLDAASFTVFTGQVEGKGRKGREIAAIAWDFDAINGGYEEYLQFAERMLGVLKGAAPSSPQIRGILSEDRKLWWKAVQVDPLLPEAITPRGYRGKAAWKTRQRLHSALFRSLDLDQIR